MNRNIIIGLVLFSLIFVGPAMAIKRVPKADNASQQTEQPGKDSGKQESPAVDKATPPPSERPEPTKKPERPTRPEKQPGGDKDRFIDENGDGLNDSMKETARDGQEKERDETGAVRERVENEIKVSEKSPLTPYKGLGPTAEALSFCTESIMIDKAPLVEDNCPNVG